MQGIRGHRSCVVLPDHVSAVLARRYVAAKRRMMRVPGRTIPERSPADPHDVPGRVRGFFRILAEASRSGDLGEAATPGLTRLRHQLGRIASTFPDVGLCSQTSVRLPVVNRRRTRSSPSGSTPQDEASSPILTG